MVWEKSKWCSARLGDAVCQLRNGHDGFHRCEVGEPILDADGKPIGQVISWS